MIFTQLFLCLIAACALLVIASIACEAWKRYKMRRDNLNHLPVNWRPRNGERRGDYP